MITNKNAYILVGSPGSGKREFTQKNNLDRYVVSYLDLARNFSGISRTFSGETLKVRAHVKNKVRSIMRDCVTTKMIYGDHVVIDDIPTTKNVNMWISESLKYGLTPVIVDLQGNKKEKDIILESYSEEGFLFPDEFIARTINSSRKIISNFRKKKNVKVIKSDEFKSTMTKSPVINFNEFKKVIVVGDIQSCYKPLKQAVKHHGGLDNKDNAWVFLGDLFDRGPNALGVFSALKKSGSNVYFVAGNHDINMSHIINGKSNESESFNMEKTFESYNQITKKFNDKDIRKFLKKFSPYLAASFNDLDLFFSHGGVSAEIIDEMFDSEFNYADDFHISNDCFIYGVSDIEKTYQGRTSYRIDFYPKMSHDRIIQFHGHRASSDLDNNPYKNVWNLETHVDRGGFLSVAVINKNGEIQVENY